MPAILRLYPSSTTICRSTPATLFILYPYNPSRRKPLISSIKAQQQNHYDVLGLPLHASLPDIKRAYRSLARKYHPDVSKERQSVDTFKSIRFAYEVLSNEKSRYDYDKHLKQRIYTRQPSRNWTQQYEVDEGVTIYSWSELRKRNRRHKQQYGTTGEYDFSSTRTRRNASEDLSWNRGSFVDVLKFTFFTLFSVRMLGPRLGLALSTVSTMLDEQLDNGYKLAYLVACVLGGRGGILLTLCLSFASWLCGKTSSSLVVSVVVAMWVGTDLARFVPLPQGAVLTLLYMSIKLQIELS